MRPVLVRHAATGAAAVLLVASLAGCASSDNRATDESPAARSSSASSPSPARAADASDAPAQGDEVDAQAFVARVVAGLQHTESAHMIFTLSQSGSSMTGEGDVDYASVPADMTMTMHLGVQDLEMRLVDKVMYLSTPATPGKFITFDLDDPDNPLGQDFVSQMDPTASMRTFAQAVKGVTFVGEEEEEAGQTLQRYQMQVTTAKLADQSPQQLPDELTMGVWLDDHDRMAKSFIDLGPATYEAELTHFDQPVTIKAPGPDQIVSR